MPYSEITPETPALRSLIACYWTITGPAPAQRVLPDGCIDILLMGGDRVRVVGTMTRAIAVPEIAGGVIGIRFRPGEAARILHEGHSLTDRDVVLNELWRDNAEIEDVLAMALEGRGSAAIAHLLDRALMRRLAKSGAPSDLRVRAAASMLEAGQSVQHVANAVDLSERQLARRFEARVGVTPKVFARVMRLQRAALALADGTLPSEAALIAGYVDQAHFTRDAKALAGATPGVLASEYRDRLADSFKSPSPIESLAAVGL